MQHSASQNWSKRGQGAGRRLWLSCQPGSLQPVWQIRLYYVRAEDLGKLSSSGGISLSPQESTLNVDLDFKQPFLELNRILEALHEQNLGPALE